MPAASTRTPPHRDSADQWHATAHPLTATALTPRRESRGPTSAVRWAEAAPRPRRWVPACPRWVSYPYAPPACRRGTRSGCDCGRQPADQQCAFDVRAGFTHTHTHRHITVQWGNQTARITSTHTTKPDTTRTTTTTTTPTKHIKLSRAKMATRQRNTRT